MRVVRNVMTAIPRNSKIGLLLFNTAIFIGKSKSCGIEITVMSLRHFLDDGIKFVWFRLNAHKPSVVECKSKED